MDLLSAIVAEQTQGFGITLTNTWKKAKKFLERHNIGPAYLFASKCVSSIAKYTELERKSVFSMINMGLDCKNAWNENFYPREYWDCFPTSGWHSFGASECQPLIASILKLKLPHMIREIKLRQDGSTNVYNCPISEDIEIGWAGTSANNIHCMFVTRDRISEAYSLISDFAWDTVDSNSIILELTRVSEEKVVFSIQKDPEGLKYFPSKRLDELAARLKMYDSKENGRSVLVYGPPGTGKSNIVRGLSVMLGKRTVRFPDMLRSRNAGQALTGVLKIYNPDAVIIEDLDHSNLSHNLFQFLDKLQELNHRNKYLFATANCIGKLDPAIIRPERFDMLEEITSLEDEVTKNIIGYDEEIYKIVKDFPIVYVKEVMTRINNEGKEYTLKHLDDITQRVGKIDYEKYKL